MILSVCSMAEAKINLSATFERSESMWLMLVNGGVRSYTVRMPDEKAPLRDKPYKRTDYGECLSREPLPNSMDRHSDALFSSPNRFDCGFIGH